MEAESFEIVVKGSGRGPSQIGLQNVIAFWNSIPGVTVEQVRFLRGGSSNREAVPIKIGKVPVVPFLPDRQLQDVDAEIEAAIDYAAARLGTEIPAATEGYGPPAEAPAGQPAAVLEPTITNTPPKRRRKETSR